MRYRSLFALILVVMTLPGGASVSTPALAQRAQSPLEIGEMSHTNADGRSIFVVVLFNGGSETIEATGEFVLVDPMGDQVARVPVVSGPIAPGGAGALAVPVAADLDPGLYTATLALEDREADVRVNSGLREIAVDLEAAVSTPTTPLAVTPVPDDVDGESGARGFPSWLLLIIGLGVTVLGVTYMRSSSGGARKPTARTVPPVSMVRKVRVNTPPPKRPATIKPLIPPRKTDSD